MLRRGGVEVLRRGVKADDKVAVLQYAVKELSAQRQCRIVFFFLMDYTRIKRGRGGGRQR